MRRLCEDARFLGPPAATDPHHACGCIFQAGASKSPGKSKATQPTSLVTASVDRQFVLTSSSAQARLHRGIALEETTLQNRSRGTVRVHNDLQPP